jgi:hypothetical protein
MIRSSEAAQMTLLVFFGVVVSLMILRLIPGLLMRLVLAIPRQRLIAMLRQLKSRRVGIVFPRKSSVPAQGTQLVFWPAPSPRRGKLVYLSSSLLVLAALVTTAFWTWHATGLMMFLR